MAPFNNAPETGTRNGRTTGRGAGAGALVGGALFVSVIALCALVIAYNGIYQFTLLVHEEETLLAHVFPVTFALLVLMAFWVSYVLRAAPPGERLWVDVVLIPLLVLAAAVPMVLYSMELIEPIAEANPRLVQVIVAVAPLAALLVAFLLWIAVRAHIRRRNAAARPRPKPSDDRTTVLRDRFGPETDEAPTRADGEPEALKARLLSLGSEDGGRAKQDEEQNEEDALPRVTPLAAARSSAERRDRAEQEEQERLEEREREESALSGLPSADDREPVRPAGPGEPAEPITDATPAAGAPEDFDQASAATVPLPRRSRSGENPIKRAAAEPPVVPGAAAPVPEPTPVPETQPRAERTAVVPGHLDDEGFQHTPPVGDPSTDEDEAPSHGPAREPVARTEVETGADEDPLPEVEELPRIGQASGSEHPERGARRHSGTEPAEPGAWAPVPGWEPAGAEAVEAAPEPDHESGRATEPMTEPAAAGESESSANAGSEPLWEPPSDHGEPSPLDDYVPPVWTPPEDDSAPEPSSTAGAAGERAQAVPALDHDTGPQVRAAFRLGSVPPGAARPEPEPLPEPEEPPARDGGTEQEGTEQEGTEPPETGPEAVPEPEPPTPSSPRPGRSLEKRAMVLKPKRPPLPDFASGPPSRRVRSEPLRPED